MNYIIKFWYQPKSASYTPSKTEYFEAMELEDAKRIADKWAEQAKAFGLEYDVTIYEITNY